MAYKAEIPYGAYWSTPFCKWQGAFQNLHAMEFAAHVARHELKKRDIDPNSFDYGVMGISVPQNHSFYGLPWLTGMIGARDVGGPSISQACATGVRCITAAAQEIETGLASSAISLTLDKISNGPHIYYPNPAGPGGTGTTEDWVMSNFAADPLGGHSMLKTAENVATKHQITTQDQHEVVLRRCEQYRDALADDRAFQKRYMSLPFDVPDPRFRKTVATIAGDEGVMLSTPEGLAKLKPVMEGGTVTFGGQTHPADGNAAIVLATEDKAAELATDPKIRVRILGLGLKRAELAHMPEAPVPAAQVALDQAGIGIDAIDAVKTHNPFAVNDVLFARKTGFDVDKMNNYGCSLIWGHPQSPMGTRGVIELIEELAIRGGGKGLFTGCAAGDTAMAIVLEVGDRTAH